MQAKLLTARETLELKISIRETRLKHAKGKQRHAEQTALDNLKAQRKVLA